MIETVPLVCHLTSVHPSYDTRIFHKECRALYIEGFQVLLVAPGPHGDGRGITLLGPLRKNWRFARMIQALFYYPILAARTGAPIVHFHDPELLPGALILRLLGRKVIYDVHEDVPADVHDKEWISPLLRKPVAVMADYIERACAHCMTRVVAATPNIAKRFRSEKVTLVQNFPLLSEMGDSSESDVAYNQRRKRFVYIGSITEIRGARSMVNALEILSASSEARLALGGEIWPESLDRELRSMVPWERVDWLGWCDRRKMMEELGKARAGLVLFQPARNHVESQPNKLFEYMSAGIPVIASDFPLWRGIIDAAKCGVLVDPSVPADIAAAMKWILDNPEEAAEMGRRGRDAVRNKYNWEKEAEALIAMYAALTDEPGGR